MNRREFTQTLLAGGISLLLPKTIRPAWKRPYRPIVSYPEGTVVVLEDGWLYIANERDRFKVIRPTSIWYVDENYTTGPGAKGSVMPTVERITNYV